MFPANNLKALKQLNERLAMGREAYKGDSDTEYEHEDTARKIAELTGSGGSNTVPELIERLNRISDIQYQVPDVPDEFDLND